MAVTAESVVVELIARNEAFDRQIKQSAGNYEQGLQRIERSSNRVANAQRSLGFQIQDISIGLATGQSAFTVFAQQAGQTASAVSEFGGTLGRVGTFLAGPYGSILIAATAVLGNLALAHSAAGKEADGQEKAEKTLANALTALDQATGIANTSQRENIRLKKEAASAALKQARDELEAAKAIVAAEEARALAGRGRTGNFGLPQNDERVTAARAEAERLAKRIADAEARINRDATFGFADLDARAANDPIERIRQQTELKVDQIKALNLSQAETTRRLTALYAEEEAAIKRVSEAARKARGGSGTTARVGRAGTTAAPTELVRELLPGAALDFDRRVANLSFGFEQQAEERARSLAAELQKVDFQIETINSRDLKIDALETGVRFAENITQQLGQAVIFSGNIGDALVNSLKAAAAEAIGSGILNILTGGRAGRSFGSTLAGIGSLFGFAGGGPVSAGQVVRINETGQELFRPNVPGRIIPAGQSSMMGGAGGAVINQTIAPNFAGNAATRDEVALMGRLAYEGALRAIRESGFVGVTGV